MRKSLYNLPSSLARNLLLLSSIKKRILTQYRIVAFLENKKERILLSRMSHNNSKKAVKAIHSHLNSSNSLRNRLNRLIESNQTSKISKISKTSKPSKHKSLLKSNPKFPTSLSCSLNLRKSTLTSSNTFSTSPTNQKAILRTIMIFSTFKNSFTPSCS